MTSTHHKTDLEHAAAGDGADKSTNDARQGIETHHVRWMLGVSLALGVVVVGAAWLGHLSTQSPPAPPSVVAGAPTH
ncbi:MAG TPA: hypothetical protein VHW60_09890 [Caulobacteraceae bacterium]|jgi:predicted outer membrane lipoprotein|nr:hypothetical protein [Caulobacteraceae bacterium]